jgi:hypothetical protein
MPRRRPTGTRTLLRTSKTRALGRALHPSAPRPFRRPDALGDHAMRPSLCRVIDPKTGRILRLLDPLTRQEVRA